MHTRCLINVDSQRASLSMATRRRKEQDEERCAGSLMTWDLQEIFQRRRRRNATRREEREDAHPLSDDLGSLKEGGVKSKAGSGWMSQTWVGVVRNCVWGRKFIVRDMQHSR